MTSPILTRRQMLMAMGGAGMILSRGLWLPSDAEAAVAEVGAGSQRATYDPGGGSDIGTKAFPANVTAGNLLIVGGADWQTAAAQVVTVSDTRSTPYTVLSGALASQVRYFIAYGIAATSGACTVTVDPAGTGNWLNFAIDEFSGINTTTPLDVDGTSGGGTGTSTAATKSITTVAANALVVGVVTHTGGNVTITETTGTKIGETENPATSNPFNLQFQIAGAAGAQASSWTMGSSVTWVVYQASFTPGAGGAAARRPANRPFMFP